jgi:DNA polymerase/3'-5' exonuclease PolX
MDYLTATTIAERLIDQLRDGCKRIEIAGSVRRHKASPGDIEIVAIPDGRMPKAIFGFKLPDWSHTVLDAILYSLTLADEDGLKLHFVKGGFKYKKFYVSTDAGQSFITCLDLFIVTPPADWGVEYLIRTGPAEFSHWMVTQRFMGGALPNGFKVEDGRILEKETGDHLPMLEECNYFNFCSLGYIEPEKRTPNWQRTYRHVPVHDPAKI